MVADSALNERLKQIERRLDETEHWIDDTGKELTTQMAIVVDRLRDAIKLGWITLAALIGGLFTVLFAILREHLK